MCPAPSEASVSVTTLCTQLGWLRKQQEKQWLAETEGGDIRPEAACEPQKCNAMHAMFAFVSKNSPFVHYEGGSSPRVHKRDHSACY